MDFYSGKSSSLPRLIYRRLFAKMKGGSSFEQAFQKELGKIDDSDFLKFTWTLPNFLKKQLPESSLNRLEVAISERRRKRPRVLVQSVFPHVADEFSLERTFLGEAFDVNKLPAFSSSDAIFTMGSCFARNFATYLSAQGVPAKNFGQAEDLNSPGSNHLLLSYCSMARSNVLEDRLEGEILNLWQGIDDLSLSRLIDQHSSQLRKLREDISNASKLIVTLGNTIDYYRQADEREVLVPKFLAMSPSEDVNVRAGMASRLKKLGTYLRMSDTKETSSYINGIYSSIRSLNADCDIIFTVSPVPIDSVIGLQGVKLRSVEVDCVSKSTIRAAFHEISHADPRMSADNKLHYLPSFEIVRWIAPVTGVKVFGAEDAASRHVSNAVLNAVCEFASSNSPELKER